MCLVGRDEGSQARGEPWVTFAGGAEEVEDLLLVRKGLRGDEHVGVDLGLDRVGRFLAATPLTLRRTPDDGARGETGGCGQRAAAGHPGTGHGAGGRGRHGSRL